MNEMIQGDLFSSYLEHKQITKPIRLIEFFAGIGSQYKALKEITDKVESYKICEWTETSTRAYNAIHIKDFNDYSKELTKEDLISALNGISVNYNKPVPLENLKKWNVERLRKCYNDVKATHNLINIMNVHGKDLEIVDTDKYEYILTYSFPCQDLSSAGLGKGMDKSQAEGGTRSGLLWEVERILCELKNENREMPQILIMENVKQVIGVKNIENFKKWELKLNSLGYRNYVQVINSKDYAIPQNRERCFMISILGEYAYDFPIQLPLKYKLKDMLEKVVDEKYYLSSKTCDYVFDLQNVALKSGRDINDRTINSKIAKTISCRGAADQRADVTNFVVDNCDKELKVKDVKRVIQEEDLSLKAELCDKLLRDGLVKENDVIRHSYTHDRLNNGIKNMARLQNKSNNNLSPTLDTRCDCLGVVVRQTGCEIRYDEGIRTFKDDCIGTLRTTDSCGDKAILEHYSIPSNSNVLEEDGVAPAAFRGRLNKDDKYIQKLEIKNDNVSNTITTVQKDSMIVEKPTEVKYTQTSIEKIKNNLVQDNNGCVGTITANGMQSINHSNCHLIKENNKLYNLRIRKLTPKECFRLMGFQDKDYQACRDASMSDAKLYHMAGDSIVVTCLIALFCPLFSDPSKHREIIKEYVENLKE